MTTELNNQALSFFNDLTNPQSDSLNLYQDLLISLNSRFDTAIEKIEKEALKNINPYGINDIKEILSSSGLLDLLILINEYSELKEELEAKSKLINNDITSINDQIQKIENTKILAELKLYRLYGTDNAAIGLLSDTKYISNIVIVENVILIIIAIIFIIIQLNLKNN